MRLLGRAALSRDDVGGLPSQLLLHKALQSLSLTIAAGSSQIQRNIVAERILGLPEGALMDFRVDEDQEALRDGIRSFCDGRFPLDAARRPRDEGGFERALWRELAEMGVFQLRLPEAKGGLGLGMADAVLVFAELGRRLVPGPLVWTPPRRGADSRRRERAKSWSAASIACCRAPSPLLVESLDDLDVLLVLRPDGIERLDPRALRAERVATPLDPLTPLHRRVASCRDGERIAGPDAARALAARGRGAGRRRSCSAIAETTQELATAYAKTREQFGRTIGSFQAIKHILADTFVRQELARAAVYAAGATLDQPEAGVPARAVSSAKVVAGDAALENSRACIQVHGGMGYTWEMPLPLLPEAKPGCSRALFGTSEEHSEQLARQVAAAL